MHDDLAIVGSAASRGEFVWRAAGRPPRARIVLLEANLGNGSEDVRIVLATAWFPADSDETRSKA